MFANAIFAILFVMCLAQRSRSIDYVEEYFDQRIDHFGNSSQTFKQRYLYNDSWWDSERAGPIFFYVGDEEVIETSWEKYGFLADIAPQFSALVLFYEHRYHGKSRPFGRLSYTRRNIRFLSVEQAMADYVDFLTSFKQSRNAENSPVIAFGGGYGGVLSPYMRINYPKIILGAISSSAPIYQLSEKIPGEQFFPVVTMDFRRSSPECEEQVRTAYDQVEKWSNDGLPGLTKISEKFHLCKVLLSMQDYDRFLRWSRNAFVDTAAYVYPYPPPMGPLPAYPVDVMCKRLVGARTPVEGLYEAISVYYNATGETRCFNWEKFLYCSRFYGCMRGDPTRIPWDYQGCTQITTEANSTGVQDMFPVLPFNSTMRDEYCKKEWDVLPNRLWFNKKAWEEDLASSSNIIFSNGNLDPWSPDGVHRNFSDTVVSIMIDGAAYQFDLSGKHMGDPPSLVEARGFEIRNIEMWLENSSGDKK